MGKNFQLEGITVVIVVLAWRQFVKEPKTIVESIIWEFYSNDPNDINNQVIVWGI